MKDWLISTLIFVLVKLLNFSYRYRWLNQDIPDGEIKKTGRYLLAVWHQNLFPATICQKKYQHVCVVSQSKDGEFVAKLLQQLGHVDVRGSSTRGGANAKKAMENCIREKNIPGAITVDGPLGPPHIVKKGIIDIAKNTETKIIPYVAWPENYWSFEKAWDKFRFPKPFSRVVIWYGDPIEIPAHLERENYDQYCAIIKEKIHEGERIAQEFYDSGKK